MNGVLFFLTNFMAHNVHTNYQHKLNCFNDEDEFCDLKDYILDETMGSTMQELARLTIFPHL